MSPDPLHARLGREHPAELDFRAVADCTYDWESWHGTDGRLIWVNPAVERLTGCSVAECHQMSDYPLPLVLPEDRPQLAAILDSARQGGSGNDREFRLLHREGQICWAAISWQPMSNAQQQLGFRTSVRDISARRKLRDELRLHAEHLEQLVQERTARIQQLEQHRRRIEKVAALGQLAAGVAHEINNPLAGMRNAFELIKADLTPQHPHFELLELIDREIERIGAIVHQMYQLYGRAPQPASEFDVRRTVAEVFALLHRVARRQGVSLSAHASEAVARVRLPEGEVKQVLYNLILNAIQASPAGAEVEVRLSADDEEVAVAVADRGPGIPAELTGRVFDPFFSTKSDEGQAGMGLGLSISRSIAEALGGRIEVQTEADCGSTFTVAFPLSAESSEPGCDPDAERQNPDRR